jgi:hypothetical protein
MIENPSFDDMNNNKEIVSENNKTTYYLMEDNIIIATQGMPKVGVKIPKKMFAFNVEQKEWQEIEKNNPSWQHYGYPLSMGHCPGEISKNDLNQQDIPLLV